MQALEQEFNMDAILTAAMECKRKTVTPRHTEQRLNDAERQAFQNCFVKFNNMAAEMAKVMD